MVVPQGPADGEICRSERREDRDEKARHQARCRDEQADVYRGFVFKA
jgi:hypothetical protein